ncbi:hypothetical protein U2F10_31095 [Leptothoe sp. EHU-05/26/07-4]
MLARLLSPQQHPQKDIQWWFGLAFSLFFAFFYGYLAMQKGFAAHYVIQDDARHYLFWMERWRDADAFPNDLIADYLQSITPVGYKLFYRIASSLHLQPEWFAKVIPMFLGMVAAGYYYGLTLAIFPVPATGVMASVMLSQHIWCTDDVVSASPRAFIYPLLIPLLFYFVRRRWLVSLAFLGLLTLFYPPVAVVATTLYAAHAVDWATLPAKWSQPWVMVHRGRLRIAIAAFILAALCILPTYALANHAFGPVVTMAEAHTIPEFQPTGRHSFFREGISRYWLVLFGGHGAILKRTIFTPVTLVAALFLIPMRWSKRFSPSGLSAISPAIHVFTKLTLVSLVWFIAAYAQAFKLHMPGRYTSHSIMLAIPILAAIAWTVILAAICKRRRQLKLVAPIAILLVVVPLFFYYPLLLKKFPKTLYMAGQEAPIYEYLQTQPHDTLIASIDYEADNIPAFARRSTLIAPEYATPFHLGYYRQIRQRAADLLKAHYTSDKTELTTFSNRYGIDFWLVNKGAFSADYLDHHQYWANNYQPLTAKVVQQVSNSNTSVLRTRIESCTVVETERFWLVNNACVLEQQLCAGATGDSNSTIAATVSSMIDGAPKSHNLHDASFATPAGQPL